ncbi:MAG TPA: UDP-N-acetylmuramoyl-tripeptide--D-alanyl-D-alanine ligase, partial [Chitinophagaceae bacterium]|nr:UDP-N-acetylmuramoyl-tripeptide--D-alanyl-D-alanine ligase [Chitinophagaceae bacterium]
GIQPDTEIAIIEMGANHAGEIAAYCQWAMPSHALITNCGKAHLEGFGSVEGVRKAKGELYDWIRETQGILFRNADLDYLFTMSQGITKQVTYGSGAADIRGVVSDPESETLSVAILTPHHECSIQTQLAGVYNLSNVLAAFAIGVHFGIPASTTKNALEAYSPDNSRSQWIQKGTNTILLDAYNANPSSMQAAIMNFRQRDAANKVLLLGAMMELGNESIAEHQMVTDLIAQSNWKAVVLVGGDFKHIQHPYQYFDSVAEAAAWYKEQKFSHTHILIKGSRAMTMEKILED